MHVNQQIKRVARPQHHHQLLLLLRLLLGHHCVTFLTVMESVLCNIQVNFKHLLHSEAVVVRRYFVFRVLFFFSFITRTRQTKVRRQLPHKQRERET